MDITTRISSKPAVEADHHPECSGDHFIREVRFTSATGYKGFAQTTARNCLFYEMEDAAYDSIVEAWETSDGLAFVYIDEDAARDAAAVLAERADALASGGRTHVRSKVEAA
jgi:hypothetical protein